MNRYELLSSNIILSKTEQLLNVATNRYKITVQVAHRAKRRRYEDIDIIYSSSSISLPVTRCVHRNAGRKIQ